MRKLGIAVLAVISIVCVQWAPAQGTLPIDSGQGGRVALVVGNSSYKDSPLANPVNDAADLAKMLEELGFKVILRRNASARDMRQAIREFSEVLKGSDVGLFFYAGHGVQVKGSNYLIPIGADIQDEADVEDLAIDATYVVRTMEDAQAKVNIVILDACRNNPFSRQFRSAARGLVQMSAGTGSVIAFSTAPGSIAADGSGRNGIYTKHLLASLNQANTDIYKVFQRTRAAVVAETGGKQIPWESTSLVTDFAFTQTLPLDQSAVKPNGQLERDEAIRRAVQASVREAQEEQKAERARLEREARKVAAEREEVERLLAELRVARLQTPPQSSNARLEGSQHEPSAGVVGQGAEKQNALPSGTTSGAASGQKQDDAVVAISDAWRGSEGKALLVAKNPIHPPAAGTSVAQQALSREDVFRLVNGKYLNVSPVANSRWRWLWEAREDGSFSASGSGIGASPAAPGSARGRWWVTEDAKFCFEVKSGIFPGPDRCLSIAAKDDHFLLIDRNADTPEFAYASKGRKANGVR